MQLSGHCGVSVEVGSEHDFLSGYDLETVGELNGVVSGTDVDAAGCTVECVEV